MITHTHPITSNFPIKLGCEVIANTHNVMHVCVAVFNLHSE